MQFPDSKYQHVEYFQPLLFIPISLTGCAFIISISFLFQRYKKVNWLRVLMSRQKIMAWRILRTSFSTIRWYTYIKIDAFCEVPAANKSFTIFGSRSWSNQQHLIILLFFGLQVLCSAFVLYIYICSLLGWTLGWRNMKYPNNGKRAIVACNLQNIAK